MESQLCTKISNEVNKLFNMDKSDIMKFMAAKDELVRGDCVCPFTIDEVSVIAFICVNNVTHDIYLCCNIFV